MYKLNIILKFFKSIRKDTLFNKDMPKEKGRNRETKENNQK